MYLFAKLRLRPNRDRDKDIPGYRSSGKIRVASRQCSTVPVAAPGGGGKKYELPLFSPLCPAFSFTDVDTYAIDYTFV